MANKKDKSTKNLIGYSILIALVATVITPVLSLISVGQLMLITNFYVYSIIIGSFVVIVCFLSTSRDKNDVYTLLGVYFCILFIVLIIFLSLGIFQSRL